MSRRVCLLTGASGLVGSAFIQRCAERYQIIAVHNEREIAFASQEQSFVDPLEPARAVAGNDFAVHALRVDLSRASEIEELVARIAREHGNIDLQINAAALCAPSPLLSRSAIELVDQAFAVNVIAPLRLATILGRTLWSADCEENVRRKRNIINVSSTAGEEVYEDRGLAIFSSASAALNHLTYHLASELWHVGIRVNAVLLDPARSSAAVAAAVDSMLAFDDGAETGQLIRVEVRP